jgi:hypothetical protein
MARKVIVASCTAGELDNVGDLPGFVADDDSAASGASWFGSSGAIGVDGAGTLLEARACE